jgi:hypothetical protein
MTNGFDEAKAQRNWLERLGEKIPGFRGFQDRELRREVDKMQREYLAGSIADLKGVVRDRARSYTDAAQIGSLHLFDRLDRRLDGLSQAIRFSDYGVTGFFDVEKIGEGELEKVYEFDLSLLGEIEDLTGALSAIPSPGQGDPEAGVEVALQRLSELEEKWSGRGTIINDIVKTSS